MSSSPTKLSNEQIKDLLKPFDLLLQEKDFDPQSISRFLALHFIPMLLLRLRSYRNLDKNQITQLVFPLIQLGLAKLPKINPGNIRNILKDVNLLQMCR